MSRRSQVVVCAIAAVLLTACARFTIRTPVATRPVAFSGFEVVYSPELPADRQRLLNRYEVPNEMASALRGAYPAGQGPFVRVILTQFRSGRWGPTRMHAVVQVLGPGAAVLNQVEADSTTVRGGSRAELIQRVAEDIVDQIAQRL